MSEITFNVPKSVASPFDRNPTHDRDRNHNRALPANTEQREARAWLNIGVVETTDAGKTYLSSPFKGIPADELKRGMKPRNMSSSQLIIWEQIQAVIENGTPGHYDIPLTVRLTVLDMDATDNREVEPAVQSQLAALSASFQQQQ